MSASKPKRRLKDIMLKVDEKQELDSVCWSIKIISGIRLIMNAFRMYLVILRLFESGFRDNDNVKMINARQKFVMRSV